MCLKRVLLLDPLDLAENLGCGWVQYISPNFSNLWTAVTFDWLVLQAIMAMGNRSA
jgi:hypothetical protein